MSHYVDLPFYLGEDWKLRITARDGDGNVIDLTSATIQFRIASSSAALLTAGIGSGISVSNALGGVFTVDITASMQSVAGITAGAYRYECRVTTAGSIVSVQIRGTIAVLETLFDLPATTPTPPSGDYAGTWYFLGF